MVTFGPSYQPVPALIIPTLALMTFYARVCPSQWHIWLAIVPAFTVGSTMAYYGAMRMTRDQQLDSGPIFAMGLLFAVAVGFTLTLDRAVSRKLVANHPLTEIWLTLPVMWCAAWTLIYQASPFGDTGSWGHALAMLEYDPLTVGVTWTFGIVAGGSYVTALIASGLVYIYRHYIHAESSGYEPIISN